MQRDMGDGVSDGATAGLPAVDWSRAIAIGECMVEVAPSKTGGHALGYAGDTFNTAWYLRRLCGEGPAIDYLSAVGDDRVSDDMLRFMEGEGIGTVLVRRIPGKSVGLYLVTLDGGERSFSYWRATSAARELAEYLSGLAGVGAGCLIYLSGITLAILSPTMRNRLLDRLATCRDAGAVVVFDPNIRPRLWEDEGTLRQMTEAAARQSDIVFPSFDDEAVVFGDATPDETVARYAALGVPLCIVKNGAGDIRVGGRGTGPFWHGVSPVAAPVDTTAAGDAFNAGVLAALRLGVDLKSALAMGASVSRHVIGGRGALVDLPEGLVPLGPEAPTRGDRVP